jgi:sugar O-acyltransferase (sialic acid O-acetyltransferase NeuD family)
MENPVIILGAKGLGKAALDIFKSNGVDVYCFLEDDTTLHNSVIEDIPVIGKTDDDAYLKILGKSCEAFIASDDNKYRMTLTELLLERKIMPVNAIHKAAYIASSASIGHGNFIGAGAIINSYAKISSHCIIYSNAVVEFESEMEDFVQIGAGAIINPGVKIAKGAFIGAGAIIVAGVTIGKNARIGAGSVVISNVNASATVFGNPAQPVAK